MFFFVDRCIHRNLELALLPQLSSFPLHRHASPYSTMSFAVPNLPGFRSNRQIAQPKSQNFTISRDGVPSERHAPVPMPAPETGDDLSDRFRTTAQLAQTGNVDPGLTRKLASTGAPTPGFVALDRQVRCCLCLYT